MYLNTELPTRWALSCSPALVFLLTVRHILWWASSLLFVVQLWAVGSCIEVWPLFCHHLSTWCLHIGGLEASLFSWELRTPSCEIHICALYTYQSSRIHHLAATSKLSNAKLPILPDALVCLSRSQRYSLIFHTTGGPDLRCLDVKVLQGFGASPANMISSAYLLVAEVMLNPLVIPSTRILQERGRQVPSVIPFSIIFSNQSKAN